MVDIFEMTYEHIEEWVSQIQPIISGLDNRADKNWNWNNIYTCRKVLKILMQKPKGFVAMIDGIIVGMMMATLKYGCKDNGTAYPSYLWLLSKNPMLHDIIELDEQASGKRSDVPFGEIMYNVLLLEIEKVHKPKDSFWLHADPKAPDPGWLMGYYIGKKFKECKLGRMSTFRRDDGRYFYYPYANKSNILAKKLSYTIV